MSQGERNCFFKTFTVSFVVGSAANEHRAWLLHYAIPVLEGVLPAIYLSHFALLAWAVERLLGDKVQESDVEKSQRAIDDFCRAIPFLYG